MTLPERLTKLRKLAGLSQEEVADKLEVTRQTVSKWETGQSSPDLDKVLPLCGLYNVTPDELLHDKGTEGAEKEIAESNFARSEEQDERIMAKKRLTGILGGVLLYFIAIAFIMIAIPVLGINSVASAAVFVVLFALATLIIIYSAIIYKKKSHKKVAKTKEEKIYKNIDSILAFSILAIYLLISFMTMAWHITWIIWIIYAVLSQIVKLIITLVTGKDIEDEDE
jgi:transcriptional regulator with XRE-family HTH domain